MRAPELTVMSGPHSRKKEEVNNITHFTDCGKSIRLNA